MMLLHPRTSSAEVSMQLMAFLFVVGMAIYLIKEFYRLYVSFSHSHTSVHPPILVLKLCLRNRGERSTAYSALLLLFFLWLGSESDSYIVLSKYIVVLSSLAWFLSRNAKLVLTDCSFTFSGLFRKYCIAWDDISEIGYVSLKGQKKVGWVFTEDFLSRRAQEATGFFKSRRPPTVLSQSYDLDANTLAFLMSAIKHKKIT